jgi:MFS family permease
MPTSTQALDAIPISVRGYYGWVVLLVAAAAMVGTLPGRTQGLGLITEPLISELGIDRVAYAQLNLWATIAGAAFALGAGRFLDRFGSRAVVTIVGLALGAAVVGISMVRSFWELAVLVTLTRGLGQSALSVVSLAMVGQWFVRRIDTAMAVYSVVLSVGFMIAFPVVGSLVQARGWRVAWLAIGVALIAILAPLTWLLVRRSPESCGLQPDGDLVASGIGLFNESILAERGFPPGIYYQTLVVTALTALAGNFLGGWLATRVALPRLLAASLFVLTAGLAALPRVTSVAHVMVWATAMGLGGGLVMVLFFTVWPRVYGRRALGRIQGSAQALTVLASAIGPLLLAWCVQSTGSYAAMFQILAGLIALVGVSALVVVLPPPVHTSVPVAPWR